MRKGILPALLLMGSFAVANAQQTTPTAQPTPATAPATNGKEVPISVPAQNIILKLQRELQGVQIDERMRQEKAQVDEKKAQDEAVARFNKAAKDLTDAINVERTALKLPAGAQFDQLKLAFIVVK